MSDIKTIRTAKLAKLTRGDYLLIIDLLERGFAIHVIKMCVAKVSLKTIRAVANGKYESIFKDQA